MAFPYLPAFLLCGQGPPLALTIILPDGSVASVLNQPCAQWCGQVCPRHSWQKAGIIVVLMQVTDGEELGVWGHITWYHRELMHIHSLCLVCVYLKLKKEL